MHFKLEFKQEALTKTKISDLLVLVLSSTHWRQKMAVVQRLLSAFRVGFRSGCDKGRGKVLTESERTTRLIGMIRGTKKYADSDVQDEFAKYMGDFHPTKELDNILQSLSEHRPEVLISVHDQIVHRST